MQERLLSSVSEMAQLNPEKLLLLPLLKTTEPGQSLLQDIQKLLGYGLLWKIELFTHLRCKNQSQREDFYVEGAGHWNQEPLSILQQLALEQRSRFIVLGELLPVVNTLHQWTDVEIRLGLYDACLNTMVIRASYEVPVANPVAMGPLNRALNLFLLKMLATISPKHLDLVAAELLPHTITDSLEAFQHLIQAEETTNNFKKLDLYEAALCLDPQMEMVHAHLAKLYRLGKGYQQSIYHFNKALALSKASHQTKASYLTDKGICHALLKQNEEAILVWQQAIQMDPEFLNPYLNIANSYEDQENYELAEQYFLKAQVLSPDDYRIAVSLARIYSKTMAWDKAVEQYKRQLEQNDADPWCHSDLANCYMQLGDQTAALYHLERVAKLDPDGDAGQFAQMILSQVQAAG